MKRNEKITQNSRSSDKKSKKNSRNPQPQQLITVTSGSASEVVSTSQRSAPSVGPATNHTHGPSEATRQGSTSVQGSASGVVLTFQGSATSAGPATNHTHGLSEATRQGSTSDQGFKVHDIMSHFNVQGHLELLHKHLGVPQQNPASIYPGNSGHYLPQPQQPFMYPSCQNQMGASSMMPLQQHQFYHVNQNQHGGNYVAALPQPLPDPNQQGGAFMQPVQQHHSYSGSQNQQEGLGHHLSPEEQQFLYAGRTDSHSQILQGWPDMVPQQSQPLQSDIGAQYQQDGQGLTYGNQYAELVVQQQQAHYGNQYQLGGAFIAPDQAQPCLNSQNEPGQRHMEPQRQFQSHPYNQNQLEWLGLMPQQSQFNTGSQYQQEGEELAYGSQYGSFLPQQQSHNGNQYQRGRSNMVPVHQPQTHEQSHSDYASQFPQGNSQQQDSSGIDLNLNVGLGQQQLRSSTAATPSSHHPQQVESFDQLFSTLRSSQTNPDVSSGRLGENVHGSGRLQQQLRRSTAATSSSHHRQQVESFDQLSPIPGSSQTNQNLLSGRLGENRLQQHSRATDQVNFTAGSSMTIQDGHNGRSAENPITVDASEQDVVDQSW